MTWQAHYRDHARVYPDYFRGMNLEAVTASEDDFELFRSWLVEHGLGADINAAEYRMAARWHGADPVGMVNRLRMRLETPWSDPAMTAALELAVVYHGDVPAQIGDSRDVDRLAEVMQADPGCFELWRDGLVEASRRQLTDGGTFDVFVDACWQLAAAAEPSLAVGGGTGYDGSASNFDAAGQYAWQSGFFRLGVALSPHPQSVSYLDEEYPWTDAQHHLSQCGVNPDDLAERISYAAEMGWYQDEWMDVRVDGQTAYVVVTTNFALNAHNTGILATLDRDRAYTNYVQFKELVMFYVDESDMRTSIYNVLKTFGDLWVDGNAESYVVRRGEGSKAYFAAIPVTADYADNLIEEVSRCSNGMRVEVED